MEEIHKLRAQISSIVQANFPGLDTGFVPSLEPPSDLQVSRPPCRVFLAIDACQIKVLRQLLSAAFIDQVAVRKDKVDRTTSTGTQYKNSKGIAYRAIGILEDVFIHPSSILSSISPPEYVVYHEVVRTTRTWMKGEHDCID